MEIIEKLPWYDNYMLILEGKRIAEIGIEDLENPEKQLQRVKKFFQNMGADYSRNQWISQVEADITLLNKGEDSRLSQLKREVRIGVVLENAIENQDDESIAALNTYKDDESYRQIVKQIMFYIGVSKVKKDPEFIKKAYYAIYRTYPLERAGLFIGEGANYYVYYFQCAQSCIKLYQNHSLYEDVKKQVKDRCYNAKLMFNGYQTDMYISSEIKRILAEISNLEALMDEIE